MADESPGTKPPGLVCTFYSYKGGVGRSMAVANVGAALAMEDQRVLLVDWDLEAPGLETYFRTGARLVGDPKTTPGVLDMLEARTKGLSLPWTACLLKAQFFGHSLDIISSGRKDGNYRRRVQQLDWGALFDEHRVGNYINTLRDDWRAPSAYDIVLIDSRTGITDIGDICTVLLPDILVLMFVANLQNIEGIKEAMNRAVEARSRLPLNRSKLLGVPVPSRDERDREYDRSVEWQNTFTEEFADLYKEWLPMTVRPSDALNRLYIPYVAKWSFGERIPVIEHARERADPSSLGAAYSRLATLLKHRLDWAAVEATASLSDLAGTRAELSKTREEKQAAERIIMRTRWIGAVAALVALLGIAGYSTLAYLRRAEQARQRAIAIAESVAKTASSEPLTASLLIRELGPVEASGLLRYAQDVARQGLPSLVWKERDALATLEFSPDDQHVVANTSSGAVKLLDGSSWRTIGQVSDVSNGRPLASSFRDKDTFVTLRQGIAEISNIGGTQMGRRPVDSPLALDSCTGPQARSFLRNRVGSDSLGLTYAIDARIGEKYMLVLYSSAPPQTPGSPFALQIPNPFGVGQAGLGGVGIFDAATGKCVDVFADTLRVAGSLGSDGASAVAVSTVTVVPSMREQSLALPPPLTPPTSSRVSLLGRTDPLPPIEGQVAAVSLSGDGRIVLVTLTSGLTASYAILDLNSDPRSWSTSPQQTGSPIAVSRSGKYMALSEGISVRVKAGVKEWPIDAGGIPVAAAFDQAETRLVLAGADGTVRVWDLAKLGSQPDASAQWDVVVKYLTEATKACLDETQRHNLLAEDWLTAGTQAQECRRTQPLPGDEVRR